MIDKEIRRAVNYVNVESAPRSVRDIQIGQESAFCWLDTRQAAKKKIGKKIVLNAEQTVIDMLINEHTSGQTPMSASAWL